ncbi:hypothetical protein GJ496_001348 [Pomphorhynchus laevis]|nr:hypothetical protein GJ496_001348 [Pomphorhynchus laevis]
MNAVTSFVRYQNYFVPLESHFSRTWGQLWIEQSSLKLHENSETDLPFGVKFVGFGLSQACVNVATHFEIHASYLQTSDVQISIKDPLSNFIQSSITKRSSEIWDVVYIPERIGTHEIVIKFGTGKSAVIFPNYNVNVFDPSKVKIKFKRQCFAHRITNFKVDINEAGCGSLEIVINKGAISSYAVEISKLVYKVYFVAEEIGTAIVEIWMNKITIPGTPIVLNVIEPSRIHLIGDLSTGLLNEQQTIRIIAPDLNADDLKCSITDPSNRPVASDYLNSSCKETICTFKPETVGNFTIALSAFGQQLLNSPYKMNVIAPDQAQINKLSDYIWLNIISEFEVDARSTGILNYDSLLVKINDGNVPCNVTSISEGQYLITFKPVSSIDHVIDVFYNNFRLKGTPHVCKVLTINDLKATGPGLVSSSVNQRASFSISSITQINPNDLNILITSHNKKLVEYEIQQSDEKIDVFYIPTIVGIHSIWLKIAGVNLSDSPFHVPVCDPSKVTVDINHDDFIVGKSFTFIGKFE